MKIFKDSIFSLVDDGYLTLQIPEFYLDTEENEREYEEYPDDYFWRVKGYSLATGKESGILHLSPKGFENLKHILKDNFPTNIEFTFEDVEKFAANYFEYVRKATRKKKANLLKKLNEIPDL